MYRPSVLTISKTKVHKSVLKLEKHSIQDNGNGMNANTREA